MTSETYDKNLSLMQCKIDSLRQELDLADELHYDEVDKLYNKLAEALNEIAVLKKQLRRKMLS